MPKSNNIQANQFYAILFVGRMLTTLTYIPYITKGSISSDQLIEIALTCIFGIVFVLPTYFLIKDSKDRNILDHAGLISPTLKKVLAVLYAVVFIFGAVSVITRFDVFVSMEMFLGYDYSLFMIIIIIASAYAAWLGLEAIARSSVITTALLVIAVIILGITVADKIDLLNLTPVMYNGFMKILTPSVVSISRSFELMAMGILLPKVTGKIKKGYFIFIAAIFVFAEIMFFLAVTVLGAFGSTKFFPLYTISLLAEFSVFQRINTIVTGVWIFCVFLKTGFMIYLATECMEEVLKPKKNIRNIIVIVCGAIISVAALLVSGNIERFEKLSSPIITISMFLLLAVIVPIALIIAEKVREKGVRDEKNI